MDLASGFMDRMQRKQATGTTPVAAAKRRKRGGIDYRDDAPVRRGNGRGWLRFPEPLFPWEDTGFKVASLFFCETEHVRLPPYVSG